MTKLKFEFASTGGGDVTGGNDAVLTPFKGNVFYSLAREAIQNIIDAKDPSSNEPVEAIFRLTSYQPDRIPGFDQLLEVLKKCRETYKDKMEVADFYDAAILKINNNFPIDVLIISDYNTLGLSGDDMDDKGRYFTLMKSIGSSYKSGGEGGSFGLGKGAYFVASSFRTIFISSVYGKDKYVFQGKSRLASFWSDGEYKQGNGSYGYPPKQLAVRKKDDIPDIFLRDEQGTDIHIIGFRSTNNWKDSMIRAVLNSFWYAIFKKIIIITIEDVEISFENLDTLIHKYFSLKNKDTDDEPNPLPYYHAFIDSDHKLFEETFPILGDVKLYVLEKEGFPEKISYIRQTGMTIQKNQMGSINDYAATFICENEKGNKVLRAMENETHDKWSKDFVNEENSFFEAAKEAEKELKYFVRTAIRSINLTQDGNVSEIGDLEDYLSLPANELTNKGSSNGDSVFDEISLTETAYELSLITGEQNPNIDIKRDLETKKETQEVVPGDLGGPLPVITGTGGGHGTHKGGREDKNGDIKVSLVKKLNYYRTFVPTQDDGKIVHFIIIKKTPYFNGAIEIKAGTDDSLDTVEINKVTDVAGHEYKTSGNIINNVRIGADGNLKLKVIFDTNEKYSLNLTAV